jgi:hypothetical protein
MADFLLDSTHDLDLSTNDIQIVTGDSAIKQHLKIRLQFFLGEWFLNVNIGIPYWTEIFIKNPKLIVIQSFFRRAILTTPGVASVDKLDLVFASSTRLLTISFTAVTDGGELNFSEEFALL